MAACSLGKCPVAWRGATWHSRRRRGSPGGRVVQVAPYRSPTVPDHAARVRQRPGDQACPLVMPLQRDIKKDGIRSPPTPRPASTRRAGSMSASPAARVARFAPSKSMAT